MEILSFFYLNKKGYVRQINRELKVSEHTLLKYLESLEKKDALIIKKEGNLKIFLANQKSFIIKTIFSYFDLQRMEKLELRRRKAIKSALKELMKKKIPYFVILFGSSAKNNYSNESDIDIISVFESTEKAILKSIREIQNKVKAETDITTNIIPMGIKEFLKEKKSKQNFALQDALESGYPIFGNLLFYAVMQED